MATSGTYTHSRNRDQLLTRALRLCGAIGQGETSFDSSMLNEAAEALNAMVKHWQATGIHIWRTVEATLFLQSDQVRYELASTSSDHATESFTQTTIATAAADAASSIVVSSATGFTVGYYVGVIVDDGTMHWTTVSSVSSTTIGLTSALDDSAAAGNIVIVYQTKLVRPLKVLSARRHNFDSAIDTPVDEFDREEYQDLPNKTANGVVNGYFYDRRGGANSTGYLYTWQPSDPIVDCLKMTVARPIQDFSAASDDADLPQEWIETIVWNLAANLGMEYDTPEPKQSRNERKAAQLLAEVNWWEKELTDVQLVVAR